MFDGTEKVFVRTNKWIIQQALILICMLKKNQIGIKHTFQINKPHDPQNLKTIIIFVLRISALN